MNNFNRIELEQVRREISYISLRLPESFFQTAPPFLTMQNAQVSPRAFNFGAPLRLVGGVCRGDREGWRVRVWRGFLNDLRNALLLLLLFSLPSSRVILWSLQTWGTGARGQSLQQSCNPFRHWLDDSIWLNRNAILLMAAFITGGPLDGVHCVPNVNKVLVDPYCHLCSF